MNKFQCPQCGATSSMKVSATQYHCIYCDSDFDVKPDKADLIDEIMKKAQANSTRSQFKYTTFTPSPIDPAATKRIRILISVAVGVMFLGIVAAVLVGSKVKHGAKSAFKGDDNWSAASIGEYKLFTGSKGPVAWILREQSGYSLDSERYTMQIIDPSTKKSLHEFLFVPDMTWHDGFNSSRFIGDFTAFGDTCWQSNEKDGLIARDIYTGNVIVDAAKMKTMYPKLSAGVTKAQHSGDDRYFELTTADGFEYVFIPQLKKLIDKKEWDEYRNKKDTEMNFFILSESQRPRLFFSTEKTNSIDPRSHIYESEVEEYAAKNGMPDYVRSNTKVFTEISGNRIFYHGRILSADDNKVVIAYRESNAATAAMHISCFDKTGKMCWELPSSSISFFKDAFAENDRAINSARNGNKLILYLRYDKSPAVGVEVSTGKTEWTFKPDA